MFPGSTIIFPLNTPDVVNVVPGGNDDVLAYVTFESEGALNAYVKSVYLVTFANIAGVLNTGNGL